MRGTTSPQRLRDLGGPEDPLLFPQSAPTVLPDTASVRATTADLRH